VVGKRGLVVKIGVLALQGAVAEHIKMLEKTEGVEAVPIKKISELDSVSGLVIPGGESTAIGKLMRLYGFIEPIQELAKKGFPVFGTCAGMIIIANEIENQTDTHLGIMDIHVQRNAFGRQRESFECDLPIKGVAEDFRAVFIRAPLILNVGNDVDTIATHQDRIVAARQGNILAASFHPELTDDARLHHYFVSMIKEYINQQVIHS
jgi:5'-phosphate synthase pdxT subunit